MNVVDFGIGRSIKSGRRGGRISIALVFVAMGIYVAVSYVMERIHVWLNQLGGLVRTAVRVASHRRRELPRASDLVSNDGTFAGVDTNPKSLSKYKSKRDPGPFRKTCGVTSSQETRQPRIRRHSQR